MDVLFIILRTVREAIQSTGAPPDPLQEAIERAERSLRRSLGGATHHISRAPYVTNKARVQELVAAGLETQVIAERVGVSDRYVRQIRQQLRRCGP